LRHGRRVAAGDLFDQTVRRFALGDVAQTGAYAATGIESVAAAAINLKDGMSQCWIARFCQYAGSIGIGFSERVPTDDRHQTDRQAYQDRQSNLLPRCLSEFW
jgi:hypothetical protein